MYGFSNEDIYSTVRPEAFTDTPYNSQNDSGNMSEYLPGQGPLGIEKNIGDIMVQKRNLLENVNTRNRLNGSKEEMVFNISKIREGNKLMPSVQSEFVPTLSYEEVYFGNPFENDFPMDVGVPENKMSYVSKRSRSSSHGRKDYQDGNYGSKFTNASLKCKQAKYHFNEGAQNYVSPRPETYNKSKEKMADKLSSTNPQFPNNNILKCIEKKPVEVIDLEIIDSCDSNLDKNKVFSSTSETPSRLLGTDIDCIDEAVPTKKRNTSGCSVEEITPCLPVKTCSSQPQQIQANLIIEQLIKDTVGFEFEAIRQLLYLQHMSLLRHLHKTLEVFENHNSSNCEFMLKVIDELVQENRLLRKAVIAHQRRI